MTSRNVLALESSLALHMAVVAAALWLASAPVRRLGSRHHPAAIAAFIVAPSEDARFPGLNPADPRDDWIFQHGDASAALSIPAFGFDVAKIAGHAEVLFPFLTPGLSLDHFALGRPHELRQMLSAPAALDDATPRQAASKPPLALDGAMLQALVDKSWSRRDRWRAFQPIIRLADEHDGDRGQLPALLQAYRDQNWLQPYADGAIRDPRLWTELGLAADHVNFIGFVRQYASEHPSAKATTELLFLLDKVAQASRDALADLLDTRPSEQLRWTETTNRSAYRFILELRTYYLAQAGRKGLTSAQALTAYYDATRLEILNGILRSTPGGYRAGDARFVIGAIYWNEGKPREALASWRGMKVDPGDSYAQTYSAILSAIDGRTVDDDGHISAALATEISRILNAEHGRWLVFSYERLRKFGFRFDTF